MTDDARELARRIVSDEYRMLSPEIAAKRLARALLEQDALAKGAEDDCQRAIERANKLALDVECLEKTRVDAGAFAQVREERDYLRELALRVLPRLKHFRESAGIRYGRRVWTEDDDVLLAQAERALGMGESGA